MNMAKYILRMDDIAPEMNWNLFWNYIEVFQSMDVLLLRVIPDNKDQKLMLENRTGISGMSWGFSKGTRRHRAAWL